jgi:hypothetical protein
MCGAYVLVKRNTGPTTAPSQATITIHHGARVLLHGEAAADHAIPKEESPTAEQKRRHFEDIWIRRRNRSNPEATYNGWYGRTK